MPEFIPAGKSEHASRQSLQTRAVLGHISKIYGELPPDMILMNSLNCNEGTNLRLPKQLVNPVALLGIWG